MNARSVYGILMSREAMVWKVEYVISKFVFFPLFLLLLPYSNFYHLSHKLLQWPLVATWLSCIHSCSLHSVLHGEAKLTFWKYELDHVMLLLKTLWWPPVAFKVQSDLLTWHLPNFLIFYLLLFAFTSVLTLHLLSFYSLYVSYLFLPQTLCTRCSLYLVSTDVHQACSFLSQKP